MHWRTVRSLAAASALWACAGCSYDIGQADYPSASARARSRMAMAEVDLLKQQPAPDCRYRGGKGGEPVSRAADGAGESKPDEAHIKLDYERQCYKHAEMIARERLAKLQITMRHAAQRSVRAEVRSLATPN
jgi:hypothetical protein